MGKVKRVANNPNDIDILFLAHFIDFYVSYLKVSEKLRALDPNISNFGSFNLKNKKPESILFNARTSAIEKTVRK